MRSYISSFSAKVLVFVGILVLAAGALELYCRYSPTFNRPEQNGVRRYTLLSGKNAAFGDSQIGESEKIPGFDFFGPGGLQTVELNRIVRYLYATDRPDHIIVELAPQWFGQYHSKRAPIIAENSLPPTYFKSLLLSPYFYRSLKDDFIKRIASILSLAAVASEFSPPDPNVVFDYSRRWTDAIEKEPGIFNWAKFPVEGRRVLTLARAYAQNPVQNFETSDTAANLEDAIEFLISRGAQICFFEPPITDEYKRVRPLIDGSNYAKFEVYAQELSYKYNIKWVRNLIHFPDDDYNNQDHLHPRGVEKLWPLVARACFPDMHFLKTPQR